VKVGSSRPLYLYPDRLCARSGYFRAALQGGFAESKERCMEIPWAGNTTNCELFLYWLGLDTPDSSFNSNCAMQFLTCCAYFQVSEDYWNLVQTQVAIPAAYSQTTEEMKTVWVRQTVPFSVMKRIVERVPSKLNRLVFMFAWFNEKTATTPSDKRVLETCEDFFLMRDLAIAFFQPVQPQNPSHGSYPQPYTPVPTPAQSIATKPGIPSVSFGSSQPTSVAQNSVFELFSQFPTAANSLETVWLLQKLNAGAFQGQ